MGTQTFLGNQHVAGILDGLNYDFVFICAEHTVYDIEKISDAVKYCESYGTSALVRLPELDVTFTKKVVDSGVSAVLFPMINAKEQAEKAINSTFYPLKGNRESGAQRYGRYGLDPLETVISNEYGFKRRCE